MKLPDRGLSNARNQAGEGDSRAREIDAFWYNTPNPLAGAKVSNDRGEREDADFCSSTHPNFISLLLQGGVFMWCICVDFGVRFPPELYSSNAYHARFKGNAEEPPHRDMQDLLCRSAT